MTTRGTVASRTVACICLTTLLNIPAMAATAAEPPSSHPLSMASGAHPISTGATADRVWFVGSPTESFSDVVARAIAADPASARERKDVLSGVTSRAQAGADPHLPGDAGNLDDEKVQLADATRLATRSASSPKPDAPRPDALGGTEFELRGVAVNSNRTWQVHTEIDGGFCDPEGCETTDVTRQTWKDVLSGVTSRVQAGADPHLPGDAANLDDEKVQLADATGLATRSASSPETGGVRPDALGGTDFELRGVAVNSNRTWQVHTEIDGGFCDPEGCETTDVTRQTWKVTPGRSADRFNFTSTYVGSGNLSDIYADLSVICNGRECGSGGAGKNGPRNGMGTGSPLVAHDGNAGGAQVDRIQMHAFLSRNGRDYYDSVRTGTAQCGRGDDVACVY